MDSEIGANRNCNARFLLVLEPIDCGGEIQHTHEGDGGLLVTRRDSPPLLEPELCWELGDDAGLKAAYRGG